MNLIINQTNNQNKKKQKRENNQFGIRKKNQMLSYHLIQYSLLLIICAYLVNYYAAKSVSFHVKFWSIITWTLNFAITLLVPEDVYQTFNPHHRDEGPPQGLSPLGWQYLILYWLVYLLTWTIIPVLQEWENSGDLQSSDRMRRSLRVNGMFYLYMIIGAVLGLLVLIWLDAGGQMGLITFLKCLATIWGLFLLMVLMGYALVQIPKTLWANAQPTTYLAYLYKKVSDIQDEIQQARQQFTKIVGYIMYVQAGVVQGVNSNKNNNNNGQGDNNDNVHSERSEIQRYCKQSLKIIPQEYMDIVARRSNYFHFLSEIGYLQSYPINLQSSIQHLRLLKRTIAQLGRLQRTLQYYLKNAILYEDIIKSSQQQDTFVSKDQVKENYQMSDQLKVQKKKYSVPRTNTSIEDSLLIEKLTPVKMPGQLNTILFTPKWYHSLWYMKVRKPLNKVLAVIMGTGAIILLIAETQVFLTNKSSILAWLLAIKNFQLLRIVVFIVIVFIMYMVNYSLFRLKLSNLYGLYPKDSDGPSLMFATVNFSRVGVVIVLNFFDMMKIDSQYKHVMGTVNMGLLGEWVIKGLPGILWLMVLSHYFNLWGKLMNFLKLNDSLSFNSHDSSVDNINTKGLRTVTKKRRTIEKTFLNSLSPKRTYNY